MKFVVYRDELYKPQYEQALKKQSDYERDKAQCRGAIDNPSLGNTDPKKVGV